MGHNIGGGPNRGAIPKGFRATLNPDQIWGRPMVRKFQKLPPSLSPTSSSPGKVPQPLATNVRTQNLPTLAAGVSRRSTRTALPAGRRGMKRGRESSEEENSSEDEVSGRTGGGFAEGTKRRKVKRVRTGDYQWAVHHTERARLESSSDEEDDNDDDDEGLVAPSSSKRTGLNMGALSLSPANPLPSEYASINGLLKMLHLNRGLAEPRREEPGLKRKELGGPRVQPARPIPATNSQKSTTAGKQPEVGQVDEQKERDLVTSIYEGANRALGRLMLDRRKLTQRIKVSGTGDDSDEDSGEEEEL